MGRNLISKTTEGIWTKLEAEVSHALPLSSSSKLPESNVEIPYSSHKPAQNPNFALKSKRGNREVPPETRTSLISLATPLSIPSPPSPAPVALIDLCRADFPNYPYECERTTCTTAVCVGVRSVCLPSGRKEIPRRERTRHGVSHVFLFAYSPPSPAFCMRCWPAASPR